MRHSNVFWAYELLASPWKMFKTKENFFLMSLHPHRFPRICRTGTSGLCNKPTTVEAINPFWGLLEKNMVTPSISPGLPRACTFNCFQEKKKLKEVLYHFHIRTQNTSASKTFKLFCIDSLKN